MDDSQSMKEGAARQAALLVEDGMIVGLGSGSTAALLVQALGERVRQGLRVVGVPTSEATATLAASLGIPLTTLEQRPRLDLTIDGADEVDPGLNLIKGHGGALLREKIVASASDRFAIIVDAGKLVPRLGLRFAVPVEVVPFGWTATEAALRALGGEPERRGGETPYLTDGGHYILDCRFGPMEAPEGLATRIKALTGVVEHGLFLGMADTVLVGYGDRVETLRR